ncbi:MAG: hypothetical protein HXS44_07750 [Theionarchaea archaeon]|nr:hypothetical protein [Theionarchaea archaeon]
MEYSYDANGCLVWMEDFLNKRTSYYYNTGYNYWLLSKVEYPTDGYTTHVYNRFSDSDYYKYYVTNERVYETTQVRHLVCSYTGSFEGITSSTVTVKNQSAWSWVQSQLAMMPCAEVYEDVLKWLKIMLLRVGPDEYRPRQE